METERPGTSSRIISKPAKDKQIEEVNKQIQELFKKRTELRKGTDVEGSETGSDLLRPKEGPLPQRTPRGKPRIISNVQFAPPRPGEESRSRIAKTA